MTVRDIKVRQTLKSTCSSLFLYKMKGSGGPSDREDVPSLPLLRPLLLPSFWHQNGWEIECLNHYVLPPLVRNACRGSTLHACQPYTRLTIFTSIFSILRHDRDKFFLLNYLSGVVNLVRAILFSGVRTKVGDSSQWFEFVYSN